MFTFDHSNKYNADVSKVNLNPKMLYLNPASSFFRFQTNFFCTFIQQSFFHNFFPNNIR